MPVARIITGTPQHTTAVSEYLRSQGYTVETISPGELCVDPAELELNLEGCKPEEAVAHVQALIQQQRDDPLAQKTSSATENAQPQAARIPVAYDITGRPVEFSAEQETERREHPNTMGRALVSMLSRGRAQAAAGLAQAWNSACNPVRDFGRRRAEQRRLKLDAEMAREQEEVRKQEQRARERVQQEIERQRQEAEQRRVATEKAAEERARMESERGAALRAAQEQARIEAEQQAEREQARIAEVHEGRIRAEREAARQQKSQQIDIPEATQPTGGETSYEALSLAPAAELPSPKKLVTGKKVPRQQPQRTRQRTPPLMMRRGRAPITISQKAVVTALAASIVLLLGFFAYVNRRPASPLSPGALINNGSVKQDIPFGATTITPPPATPKPAAVRTAAARTAAVRTAKRSSPVHRAARKPQRSARRLRPRSQNDPVAEDEVVVRHFQTSRPAPNSQPTASNNLKRHSDMD